MGRHWAAHLLDNTEHATEKRGSVKVILIVKSVRYLHSRPGSGGLEYMYLIVS